MSFLVRKQLHNTTEILTEETDDVVSHLVIRVFRAQDNSYTKVIHSAKIISEAWKTRIGRTYGFPIVNECYRLVSKMNALWPAEIALTMTKSATLGFRRRRMKGSTENTSIFRR